MQSSHFDHAETASKHIRDDIERLAIRSQEHPASLAGRLMFGLNMHTPGRKAQASVASPKAMYRWNEQDSFDLFRSPSLERATSNSALTTPA